MHIQVETCPVSRIAGPNSVVADPALCASLAASDLSGMAGPGLRLVSMSLDMGPARPLSGKDLRLDRRADKRSRSIAFLRLDVWDEASLIASARGVFAAASTGTPASTP